MRGAVVERRPARGGPWRPLRFVALELVAYLLPLVVFIGLWAWVSTTMIEAIVLPTPWAVAGGFVALVTAPWFPQHVVATATETVLGFTAGAAMAIGLATLLYHLPRARRALYPYILLFQLTPSIVLAPIFIIWFGFGLTSKVVVSLSTAFFVMLVATLSGYDTAGGNGVALLQSLRASRWQIFRMLILPTALPSIFAGLKTATTLALIGALVAEFITAQVGLGTLLTQFGSGLRQDYLYATVLVIAALGNINYLLVSLIQRRVVWWRF